MLHVKHFHFVIPLDLFVHCHPDRPSGSGGILSWDRVMRSFALLRMTKVKKTELGMTGVGLAVMSVLFVLII